MDTIYILWTLNFFFFTLILLFSWSKIYVIKRKLDTISKTLQEIKEIRLDEPDRKDAEAKDLSGQ